MTERCPKCGETERHYWCRCGTMIVGTVCPMCDRTREEAMERGHAGDSIPLACGTEITPDGRVILEGEVCLRRQLAQAQAEVERLRRERETLAEALRELVTLKDHLKHADPAEYERRKPAAWEMARTALALLDGERGGNVNPLAAYTDGQLYDELHRRGWVAATWPTKGGGGA